MKVNVLGSGVIDFPETMSKDKIREILSSKKESTAMSVEDMTNALSKVFEHTIKAAMANSQIKVVEIDKQVVVQDTKTDIKTIEIEKPVIVMDTKTEIKTVEVEKMIPFETVKVIEIEKQVIVKEPMKPVKWRLKLVKDRYGDTTEVIASPIK